MTGVQYNPELTSIVRGVFDVTVNQFESLSSTAWSIRCWEKGKWNPKANTLGETYVLAATHYTKFKDKGVMELPMWTKDGTPIMPAQEHHTEVLLRSGQSHDRGAAVVRPWAGPGVVPPQERGDASEVPVHICEVEVDPQVVRVGGHAQGRGLGPEDRDPVSVFPDLARYAVPIGVRRRRIDPDLEDSQAATGA